MALTQTLADAPVSIEAPAATSSEEERRIRAKLAAALISQGSSAEPVRHWTQGLARVAQALSGNIQLNQVSREAAADEAKTAAILGNLPGLGGSAPMGDMPTMAPRPRTAAALADEPPEPPAAPSSYKLANLAPRDSQDTFRTPLDAMVPRAQGLDALKTAMAGPAPAQPPMSGMNPAGAVPVQTQSITPPAPSAPQVAQAASPSVSGIQIDPTSARTIKGLMADKDTRALGVKLYEHFATKPKEQYVTETDANGVMRQRNLVTGKIESHPANNPELQIADTITANPQKYGFTGPDDPALKEAVRKVVSKQGTSVAVNNVAEPILEGLGKDFIAQRTKAQAAINQTIPSIHEARKALDEGAITGLLANGRLNLAKGAALFGIDSSKAVNTETFGSALGQQLLAHAKELGINPSNRDVVVIQGIIGGKELEEGSLRNILDMQERWSRQAVKNFNITGQQLLEGDTEGVYRKVRPMMKMEEPPEYKYQTRSIGGKSYYKKGGQWYEGTSP